MTGQFSDELISAYLDGEMTPDERARVERVLLESAEHRRLFDELRALRTQLQSMPRSDSDPVLTRRIVEQAEALALPPEPQSGPPTLRMDRERPWQWATAGLAATAAGLLFMLIWTNIGRTSTATAARSEVSATAPAQDHRYKKEFENLDLATDREAADADRYGGKAMNLRDQLDKGVADDVEAVIRSNVDKVTSEAGSVDGKADRAENRAAGSRGARSFDRLSRQAPAPEKPALRGSRPVAEEQAGATPLLAEAAKPAGPRPATSLQDQLGDARSDAMRQQLARDKKIEMSDKPKSAAAGREQTPAPDPRGGLPEPDPKASRPGRSRGVAGFGGGGGAARLPGAGTTTSLQPQTLVTQAEPALIWRLRQGTSAASFAETVKAEALRQRAQVTEHEGVRVHMAETYAQSATEYRKARRTGTAANQPDEAKVADTYQLLELQGTPEQLEKILTAFTATGSKAVEAEGRARDWPPEADELDRKRKNQTESRRAIAAAPAPSSEAPAPSPGAPAPSPEAEPKTAKPTSRSLNGADPAPREFGESLGGLGPQAPKQVKDQPQENQRILLILQGDP